MLPLFIGTTGMLGHDAAEDFKNTTRVFVANRPEIDVSDRESVKKQLLEAKLQGVDVVVNFTGQTDVARIETDAAAAAESFQVNALGPRYLAEACRDLSLRLVHFSTDYVYSQHSLDTGMFYDEFPVNIYGTHKLLGERYITSTMPSGGFAIIRVGCLYGAHRRKSFPYKFLRNVCNVVKLRRKYTGPYAVDVIDFQESTPTSTRFVVHNIGNLLKGTLSGTFSVSPKGSATRAVFAKKFLEILGKYVDPETLLRETGVRFPLWDEVRVNAVPGGSGFLPEISTLDLMNRTSHIRARRTWEEDLEEFVRTNVLDLTAFMREELRTAVPETA